MGISVAVATHNRAGEPKLTLSSLAGMNSGDQDYEILVIDTANSDQTSEVVHEFLPQFGGEDKGPGVVFFTVGATVSGYCTQECDVLVLLR